MNSPGFALTIAAAVAMLSGAARARPDTRAQICSLGAAGVGQQGTVICKDVLTGNTTQSLALSPTVSAAGGIGGSLTSHGDRVLVTNQAGGATLLRESHGRLHSPTALLTGGGRAASGAPHKHRRYRLTRTPSLFV